MPSRPIRIKKGTFATVQVLTALVFFWTGWLSHPAPAAAPSFSMPTITTDPPVGTVPSSLANQPTPLADRMGGTTWRVTAPDAPFPYHMFAFLPLGANGKGVLLQSNPDAGDRDTSDSAGMGSWSVENGRITGGFGETKASHKTGQPVSFGIIKITIIPVTDTTFTGTASALSFDLHGAQIGDSHDTSLTGVRSPS